MASRRAAHLGAALVCAILVGCAGPTIRDSAVHSQAQKSADAMVSELRTVRLAVRGLQDDKLWWRYADRMVTDSEEAATTIEATFTSRQPPSQESKSAYDEVSKQLSDAADLVVSLRVAVRLHDEGEIRSLEPEIAKAADDLERLAERVAP